MVFAVKAKGDSMVGANIMDAGGRKLTDLEIVCLAVEIQQPTIEGTAQADRGADKQDLT